MERAPKTFLQTSRGPRALHSGRTHPCLHSGYGGRPDVAALRLGARRETSPSVCHTGTRFFSALVVLPRHSSATSGLPPPPPFRQGSVTFLRALHSILSTGSPTPLRSGESGHLPNSGSGIVHPIRPWLLLFGRIAEEGFSPWIGWFAFCLQHPFCF